VICIMPRLRIRRIGQQCGKAFPLSLRQGFLDGQQGPLREPLEVAQAECAPWEVVLNDSGHMAIHAAVVPGNEIVYYGGWFESTGVYRFNVVAETRNAEFTTPLPDTDMFCASHAFLADGRWLVGGGEIPAGDEGEDLHGHGGMSGGGSRACWIYTHRLRRWDRVADLNLDPAGNPESGGRWYPTLITLYDNQVIAVAGHPDVREHYPSADETLQRHSNNTPERYSPPSNAWTLMAGDNHDTTAVNGIRDEYHRIFLLPDGHVFFATSVKGSNRYYDPFAGTFLGSPNISLPSDALYHQGSSTTAVLLPLLPGDGYTARVLIANGEAAYRITLDGNAPQWEETAPRDWPDPPPRRIHGCSVLLPDGNVFLSGGTRQDGADEVRQANGVRQGEIYEPGIDWGAGQYGDEPDHPWTTVEQAAVVRHYHSIALLMPNGSVWTAGSNGPGGQANQERRIEVYRPPYCARMGRPTITESPEYIVYRRSFTVRSPQAAQIRRVALIRCGSVTHAFDTDQRYVALDFRHAGGDALVADAPPHSAVAPPGFYMLWIVDDEGRPCRWARFVNVSAFSLRATAAPAGVNGTISLLEDVFTLGSSTTRSLRRQIHVVQREFIF
jgi:hypothetical protein